MRRHVASTLLRTPVGVIGWLVGFVTPILSPFIFPGGRLGRISDPFAVGEISISTFVSICLAPQLPAGSMHGVKNPLEYLT